MAYTLGRESWQKIFTCASPWTRYTSGMKLKAILHEAEEGGYWAEVPAMPGCVTQGETREELEANLREAISAWLAAGEGEFEAATGLQILELAV
jgi:predicted RNase H-like HicB family nuclease